MPKTKKIVTTTNTPATVEVLAVESPYTPKTPVSLEEKQRAYQEMCNYWTSQCDYYGQEDTTRPSSLERRFQAILGAIDLEKLRDAQCRAESSIGLFLLAAWAAHRIPGPNVPSTWEKMAKRAESVAKMLEKKGQAVQAQAQRDQAERYRAKAAALKGVVPVDSK